MLYHLISITVVLLALRLDCDARSVTHRSLARVMKREVPQEHSHEKFVTSVRSSLNKNNPLKIADPIFALLGNAAASSGVPQVDPDCLQQVVADQAFTNAKAANDITGMTDALIFRALERNTGAVGQKSNKCTSVTASNPEIALIQQHQDPASSGAAAINKAIVLELARQIAAIGGNPQLALQSGTFAPGQIGDPTAAGNTCDDQNDPVGCIFTRNLLVPDASAAEIDAAVKGIVSAGTGAGNPTGTCDATTTVTVTASSTATALGSPASNSKTSSAVATPAPTAGNSNAITSAQAAASLVANVNLGSCPHIAIIFAQGLEGRKETAFINADTTEFAHGSAQNPNIIAQFSCDNLVNKCGLNSASPGVIQCRKAQAAVAAQNAAVLKTGATADLWNSFFFDQPTNFAAVPVVNDQGATLGVAAQPASSNNANNAVTSASASTPASTSQSVPGGSPNAAPQQSASQAGSGSGNANRQTFTGALGGITAPAVTTGQRGFVVEGSDSFVTLAAALGRSCDIQHNKCADKANSGGQSFKVSDCDAQNTACHAAISA